MDFNVGTFMTKRAELFPDKEGLVCEGLRLTFKQMNERCNRLAHALAKLGVERGDRVAILAFNEPEYYDLFNAVAKMGAIMVTLNYRLAGPELQYIMEDSGAKVLIFSREFAEVVDSFRNEVPAQQRHPEFSAVTKHRLQLWPDDALFSNGTGLASDCHFPIRVALLHGNSHHGTSSILGVSESNKSLWS
jgi:acyl-CoA synthetase (AMP-forming)/AMP-acid ligase II